VFDPLDPTDLFLYELCFPGAVTGEAEVNCPCCKNLVTLPVGDPMGAESYICPACDETFDVDWGEGTVTVR
jgi:hypothetical protein